MRTIYLGLIIVFISLISCKKEVDVKTEYFYYTDSWNRSERIDGLSTFITNSYSNEEHIFFGTPRGVIFKTKNEPNITQWLSPGSYERKGALLDDLFIRVSEQRSTVGIGSTVFQSPALLPSRQIDSLPDYNGIGGYGLHSDWMAIRSDKNQYMFHYSSTQDTQSFCFVDFSIGNMFIRNDSVWSVQLPRPDIYYNLHVKSFFNKYFILNGYGMEIMYGDGSHKPAPGIPSDLYLKSIIKAGDVLYAFYRSSIYISKTEGESWEPLVTNIPVKTINLYHYDYYVMDNEIFLVNDFTIMHMQVTGDEITWKPIKNDGLINRNITGISSYDDTVYISSTSGTFTKPLEEFYDYVEE